MKIFAFRTIVFITSLVASPSYAEQIQISGSPWPSFELDSPSNITGQHPIYGTLVCPSLIESALSDTGVSSVLLAELPETRSEANKTIWNLRIKSGANWWSGDVWDASQLADFINLRLANIVRHASGDQWSLPSFKTEVLEDRGIVKIIWASSPKFGPGILANWPIYRLKKATASDSVKYECLGKFKLLSANNDKVELNSKDTNLTVTQSPLKLGKSGPNKSLTFRLAANFGGSPWVRMSDEPIDCKQKLEIPNFLLLSWNSKLWPTNSAELRKVLTQLSPRGELLRSGAGSLGDLVSAPILRSHPGYNKSVLVRPFSLSDSVKELERLGFKRPSPARPRESGDDRELRLKIQVDEGLNGLIEKVIFDSFHSVGIGIERAKSDEPSSEVHGRLSGIFFASRHFDWFPILKAQGSSAVLLSFPDDQQLVDFAEKYSISLTEMKPRFELLRSLHQRFYELEPLVVLLHNRACVESSFKINASALESANTNPSWLTNILGIDR
jgi:hypothetical protein